MVRAVGLCVGEFVSPSWFVGDDDIGASLGAADNTLLVVATDGVSVGRAVGTCVGEFVSPS